jgi:hypothetical protein
MQKFIDHGYFEIREIEGVGICSLMTFAFTTGLVIGMNDVGYKGRYCFSSKEEASQSLKEWDGVGDPPGNWIKYKGYGGERSNPNYKEGLDECKGNCNFDFLNLFK